ncbi:MAG: HD-GYP domain-containing protein [Bacillaceae bacterium]
MSQLIEKTAGYFPEEDIQAWEIDLAALVHYVTWIYTPDYLYEKEEILTVQEREMLKKRVEFGADLLLDMKEVERVRLGILYHREYINGQGYPYRLRGEEIPIFAQIIGIVDEYMDLTNPRINGKKQHTTEEAMTILSSLRNVCYQEKIVSAFEKVVNEMENIHPKG